VWSGAAFDADGDDVGAVADVDGVVTDPHARRAIGTGHDGLFDDPVRGKAAEREEDRKRLGTGSFSITKRCPIDARTVTRDGTVGGACEIRGPSHLVYGTVT